MRIFILGVSGLIGHKLLQELSKEFETFGLLHNTKKSYGNLPLFSGYNVVESMNVLDFEILKGTLLAVNPDVIINCVGITKRKVEINDPLSAISINSLFPHMLTNWAAKKEKRVIHFSTDCVFDGKTGNYNEISLTNAEDIYGRTKALGEVKYENSLTIRSSFIGQELFGKTELLEWFLAQTGKKIVGYTKTLYSGVSTIFMAHVVKTIIANFKDLSGLYNLAPEIPISKYELLCIARDMYKLDIEIVPDSKHIHHPTLDGARLRTKMHLKIPQWNEMMSELADNRNFYTS